MTKIHTHQQDCLLITNRRLIAENRLILFVELDQDGFYKIMRESKEKGKPDSEKKEHDDIVRKDGKKLGALQGEVETNIQKVEEIKARQKELWLPYRSIDPSYEYDVSKIVDALADKNIAKGLAHCLREQTNASDRLIWFLTTPAEELINKPE